jgi:hypothetical protein
MCVQSAVERSDELCNPLSSSDLTGTVQHRGRKEGGRAKEAAATVSGKSVKSTFFFELILSISFSPWYCF